jgi:hypothetical protein
MVRKLHTGTLAPYDEPLHFIKLGRFTVINKTAKSLKITVYGFRITIEEADKSAGTKFGLSPST